MVNKIRRATLKDAAQLHLILNNTSELRGIKDGEEYPMYWVKGAIRDKKNFMVLIAENNNKMRGFLITLITPSVRQGIIVDAYVDPLQRSKGIATALMTHFERMAKQKGLDWIIGLIEKNNMASQRLFKKLGYDKGETLHFYRKIIGKK